MEEAKVAGVMKTTPWAIMFFERDIVVKGIGGPDSLKVWIKTKLLLKVINLCINDLGKNKENY